MLRALIAITVLANLLDRLRPFVVKDIAVSCSGTIAHPDSGLKDAFHHPDRVNAIDTASAVSVGRGGKAYCAAITTQ